MSTFTGMGEAERMTQFKDKSEGLNDERTAVGLFSYPILMAADILLYNAKYVPVGDDQTQHLEFTRDIAERMNNKFGELFVVPEPANKQHQFFDKDQGLRIMDLADPTKKMSKSNESNKGVIFLRDNPDEAAKKVMSAATDNVGVINYDKQNQPGISNLLDILALLREQPVDVVTKDFAGSSSYGDFKSVLAEEVKDFLTKFQTKLSEIDEELLMNKIQTSESEMTKQASQTMLKVQKAVGLRPQGE
jgi:tryptophanyl-tRNA synthetase